MTNSKQSELTDLTVKAARAYALKDYPTSSDLYAQACTLQTEINDGDNDPQNADLLYLYGRSLYKVAQSKSDVLGGAAGESKPAPGASKPETIVEENEEEPIKTRKSGLFQFSGDENWDDDNEEEEEPPAEDEEQADDLNAAWDILDLARALYEKLLPTIDAESERYTKTRSNLADVYDLLGEVSLESENFPQASKDLGASLAIKKELYPIVHTYIPEAHFKLSLALEFSAAGEGVTDKEAEKLKEQAVAQLEFAIAACKARIEQEEEKLASNGDTKGKGKAPATSGTTKEIENVKEMVAELEQRLQDLRNPPEPEVEENPLAGLLGQMLGKDQESARKTLEAALGQANDLTGLVRKKPKAPEPKDPETKSIVSNGSGNGKRKADEMEVEEAESKKAKVEETEDSGA